MNGMLKNSGAKSVGEGTFCRDRKGGFLARNDEISVLEVPEEPLGGVYAGRILCMWHATGVIHSGLEGVNGWVSQMGNVR